MKVLVAGYGKTGTKTLAAALQELDYKVYDYFDHFWYHYKEWEKLLTIGGNAEDLKRMYDDVDATTDIPTYILWEELLKAFPDLKIVLTTRDEESWYKSYVNQIEQMKGKYVAWQFLTPTGWKQFWHYRRTIRVRYGLNMRHPADLSFVKNELVMRKTFRMHQAICLQNAPKENLLVYNVKEGWEPLCKFLGKDVPDKPFPHENIGGNIISTLGKTRFHPASTRMETEMKVSVSALTAIAFYLSYSIGRRSLFLRNVALMCLNVLRKYWK